MTLGKYITTIGTILALALAPKGSTAGEFGRVAGYYDTRGHYNLVLEGGATDLPLGTKLFGYIDAETDEDNPDNLNKSYAEVRMTKRGESGLGVAAEYNGEPFKSGTTRTGITYEPGLPKGSRLGAKFFPFATGDKGMQVGVNGRYDITDDMWVEAFLDYNFKPGKTVTEVQVGKEIKDNLSVVAEGRYNGFKDEDDLGVGIGLDWSF